MKFQKLIEKIRNPRPLLIAITFILTILICAGTITLVALGYQTLVISYIAYCLAALLLGYSVYIIVIKAPAIKQSITKKIKSIPLGNRLLADYGFRTLAFAGCSFIINIAYALFHGVFGIINLSFWYISLAGYYAILSLMRLGIIRRGRKSLSLVEKCKTYRNCGIWLIFLELSITAATTQRIINNTTMRHTEIIAIVIAVYTFYKLGLGIWNLVKAKRYNDPIVQSLRNISIIDAIVSLLTLQIALIVTFGGNNNGFDIPLNAVTGFVLCTFTIYISVRMILKGNKLIKNASIIEGVEPYEE